MTDPSRHRPMCACGIDHRSVIDGNYEVTESGCWEWQGRRTQTGYGQADHKQQTWPAHRIAYWAYVGDFPSQLQIDHLCKNRACVNPQHLEPVTRQENIRRSDSPAGLASRRTTCSAGHEYQQNSSGKRHCPICSAAHRREWVKQNPALESGDPRHGTLYGYQSFNCRCDDCKTEALRRHHLTNPPSPRELQGHGTRACYRRGCRRGECVEAANAHQRAMKQRLKARKQAQR